MADDDDIHKIEIPTDELVAKADVPPIEMDSDDFVAGVCVIVLAKDGRGHTGMYVRFTEGLDWLTRLGMLTAMADVERQASVANYLQPDE